MYFYYKTIKLKFLLVLREKRNKLMDVNFKDPV